MLYCKNCGNELEDNDKFCSKCGTPIEVETQERQIKYEGNIHKCPNCGEVLKSFVANCPSCGYELRETKNSISLRDFINKLDEIEKLRNTEMDQKIKKNTNSINGITQRTVSLIRNFPIPNTKEDLLEFIILASSNINTKMFSDFYGMSEEEEAVSDAWKSKFEQAYKKALVMFGNTTEFKNIQDIYDKTNEKIKKASDSNKKFWIMVTIANIVGIAVLFILGALNGSFSRNQNNANEIQQAILRNHYNENYDIK